jgi:hypothetical protein
MCGTVDDYVLTDDVVVADDAFRILSAELEVLRQGAYYSTLMHLVFLAHACTAEYRYEGEDDATVANLYVVFYIDEGEYLTVVADFRLGTNLGFRTYFACHNYKL